MSRLEEQLCDQFYRWEATQIAARRNYWIYIDEFANFITPTMAEILSGARKYRIGLTLAHHELHQLDREKDVASAVMSHPLTRIVFRVGDDDARKLANGFSFFEAKDICKLETGHAICRVERPDYDFNLTVAVPDELATGEAADRRLEVIELSRKAYGTPVKQLENLLPGRPSISSAPGDAPASAKVRSFAHEQESLPTVLPESKSVKAQSAEIPPTADTKREFVPPQTTAEPEGNQKLKERIAKAAAELGYSVFNEKEVPGSGRIDLVLFRGKRNIACEVHAKNSTEYEVRNVEKCLRAGFSEVVVVVAQKSKLGRVAELIKAKISAKEMAGVRLCLPDEFIADLAALAKMDPEGGLAEKSKPHKQVISLDLGNMSDAERREKEKLMLKELSDAIEGKKKGPAGLETSGGPS